MTLAEVGALALSPSTGPDFVGAAIDEATAERLAESLAWWRMVAWGAVGTIAGGIFLHTLYGNAPRKTG